MAIEENITMTETAPDGTETTIEITTTKVDDASLSDDKSLVEEIVEALFDTGAAEETESESVEDAVYDEAPGDPVMFETTPTEQEISTNSIEFTVGEDGFPVTDMPDTFVLETPAIETPFDSGYAAPADYSAESATDGAAADLAEQQAHADAAIEAQTAADEFVAQGDYAAAAEARETAENAAYEAGDSSMLGVSDSSDLENAAYKQEIADDYRAQQAEHLADGDLEAAKEDAQNVGYATGDADFLAGGADHTGQADNDEYNLNWAISDEKSADQNAISAEAYAAEGDLDNAQIYAESAGEYQASSDQFADKADAGSDFYQADPTSVVETGGTYDAGTYDAGSVGTYDAGTYDASIASIDTGIDTSIDTSAASTFDTTTDDTI